MLTMCRLVYEFDGCFELSPIIEARRKRQANQMQLPPLTLCVTKDLSRAVLHRALNESEGNASIASIGLGTNSSLNITVNGNNAVPVVRPLPSSIPASPRPTPLEPLNLQLILYTVIGILGVSLLTTLILLFIAISALCYKRRHCKTSLSDITLSDQYKSQQLFASQQLSPHHAPSRRLSLQQYPSHMQQYPSQPLTPESYPSQQFSSQRQLISQNFTSNETLSSVEYWKSQSSLNGSSRHVIDSAV